MLVLASYLGETPRIPVKGTATSVAYRPRGSKFLLKAAVQLLTKDFGYRYGRAPNVTQSPSNQQSVRFGVYVSQFVFNVAFAACIVIH